MTTPFENRNYAFAGAFVDELARCGLRHVCICPGSRSTPLALSFGRRPDVRVWMHLDERSASFFALGMARALGEPVALVCSSGTATANFHPAVAEAHNDALPLLVLTADRPPEAVAWGALQTMEQDGMYGKHAKWSLTLPPPEATPALLAYVRSAAARAWATALQQPAGPVHINFPFREPLEPVAAPSDFSRDTAALAGPAGQGREGRTPFLRAGSEARRPARDVVQRLAQTLGKAERGVILCGPQQNQDLAEAVVPLAQRLGYPIVADVLSQVRCGPHDRSLVVDAYDAFIRDPGVAASLAPEVVLRFGAVPVSKPFTQYLERYPAAKHILVDDGPGWRDPSFLTAEVVQTDAVAFCRDLTATLDVERPDTLWLRRWMTYNRLAAQSLSRQVNALGPLFEGRVYSELASFLPENAIVFAGNSMPVRDLDTFFPSSSKSVRFFANRGVSGIDGVVSSALGVAAATGQRVTLLIGDISFYHDMNGLLAAKAHGLDATIIVLNNDGGGIFSFLPQAGMPQTVSASLYETFFGTPHGLTFKAAADLYGLGYAKVSDWPSFHSAVSGSFARKGTSIIEVTCGDRSANVDLHWQVWQAVSADLAKVRG